MRGEEGRIRGERKTIDSQASSKRSDSATGSPLTLSGDNMWAIIGVFFILQEKRAPKGLKYGKEISAREYADGGTKSLTTFSFLRVRG